MPPMLNTNSSMAPRFGMIGALALAGAIAGCTSGIAADPGVGAGNAPAGGGSSGMVGTPGGGAGGLGSTSSGTPLGLNLKGSPAFYRVMRLTNDQWTNSVQTVLALPSPPTLASTFADTVSGTTDFKNNELLLDIDNRGWSDFQTAAEALATQVTSDSAQLNKLYSGTDAAGFIAAVSGTKHLT